MENRKFYLSTEIKYNCLDIVKMWGTDFELRVYSLTDTNYHVAENCLEKYGDAHPGYFAFEVSLDDEFSYSFMDDGIRWYADHKGQTEMEIHRTDPRLNFQDGISDFHNEF